MRKHLLFSVMLSLCAMGGMMVYPTPAIATVAQSPAIKVRGQVIDEQGEPLTGATVRIKGGQGGTITDVDGNFQLEVAGNAILSISYVGYKEREVAVRNRAIIEAIQLQPDNQMLEQVVVWEPVQSFQVRCFSGRSVISDTCKTLPKGCTG